MISITTPSRIPRRPVGGGTPISRLRTPQRRSSLPQQTGTPPRPSTNTTLSPMKTFAHREPAAISQNDHGEEGIQVAIRLRPLNSNESIHHQAWRVIPNNSSVCQITLDGKPVAEKLTGRNYFTFDKTFDENNTTRQVYDSSAKHIIQSVCNGLNGTIFAYGQTSSGKTFTMQGSGTVQDGAGSTEGIIHMAARDIFEFIRSRPDRIFVVQVSFLEIYNEDVRDLLSPESQKSLPIREDPKRGVFVMCKEEVVTDFNSLLGTLAQGEKSRAFASTAMNERSSRSHTIFRVTMESRSQASEISENEDDIDNGAVLVSTLNLVDLAGSESVRHTGATGERQKEGGMINTSLLTLSRVINALSQHNTQHVNFRDSKLTRILQSSLLGNARMAMICCATPSDLYLEETRSTLLFANRAKLVKTHAQVNEVVDDRSLIRRLQRELADANRQLGGNTSVHVKQLEQQVAMSSSEAVNYKDKLNRLKSSILNFASGLFGNKSGPINVKLEKTNIKRRLSDGCLREGTPPKSTSVFPRPMTSPRPEKRFRVACTSPIELPLQVELMQEALKANSIAKKNYHGVLQQVESQNVVARTRIEELQHLLSLTQYEAAKYVAERDSLRGDLKRAMEDKEANLTCISILRAKLQTQLEEKQSLKMSETELQTSKLKSDQERTELKSRLNELSKNHGELMKSHLELMSSEKDARSSIVILEETISTLKSSYETLECNHFELEREKVSSQSLVDSLHNQVVKLTSSYELLQSEQRELNQTIQTLNSQMDETQRLNATQSENIKRQHLQQQEELNRFEIQRWTLSSEIESLLKFNSDFKKEINVLHSELSSTCNACDVLRADTDALKTENLTLNEELQSRVEAEVTLRSDIISLQTSLEETIKEGAAEKERSEKESELELSKSLSKLGKCSAKIHFLEDLTASISNERDLFVQRNEESQAKLIACTHASLKLKEIITQLRTKLEDLESRGTSLKSDLMVAQDECDEKKRLLLNSLAKNDLVISERDLTLQENSKLLGLCSSLVENLRAVTADCSAVQESITATDSLLEGTNQTLLQLQESCETFRYEITSLSEVNKQLVLELEQKQAHLQSAEIELIAVHTDSKHKQETLDSLTGKVKAVMMRFNQVTEELNETQHDLEYFRSEAKDLREKKNIAEDSLKTAEASNASLHAKNDALRLEYESIMSKLQASELNTLMLSDNLHSLESTRKTLQVTIDDLSSKLHEASAEIASRRDDISVLNKEFEDMKSVVEADSALKMALRRSLTEASETQSSLETELFSVNQAMKAMELKLDETLTERNTVVESWDATKALLKNAELTINDLTASSLINKSIKEEMRSLRQNDSSLTKALEASEKRNDDLLASIEQNKNNEMALLNDRDECKLQIESLSTHVQHLEAKLAATATELVDVTNKLSCSHCLVEAANDKLEEHRRKINELENELGSARDMVNFTEVQAIRIAELEETVKVLRLPANKAISCGTERVHETYHSSSKAYSEEDFTKLVKEKDELDIRLQLEAQSRAASEAALERMGEEQRALIQEAESSVQSLLMELRSKGEILKRMEIEAYACRQDNHELREETEKIRQRMNCLEVANKKLDLTLAEGSEHHQSEISKLLSDLQAAKTEEYVSRQNAIALKKQLDDANTAIESYASSSADAKILNAKYESLCAEVEKLRRVGKGNDNNNGTLIELLKEKDERIEKLEKHKFTKWHAEQFKKLKETSAAIKIENENLRKQIEYLSSMTSESSDVTKLRFDKEALENKLRKVMTRCQALEDEKGVCVNVLRNNQQYNEDGDLIRGIVSLCDRMTSDSKQRGSSATEFDILAIEKASLETINHSQKCLVDDLQSQVLNLQSELVDFRRLNEKNRNTISLQSKVRRLEQENISLQMEKKDLKQKYPNASKEIHNMRIMEDDSIAMEPKRLKHSQDTLKDRNDSSNLIQPLDHHQLKHQYSSTEKISVPCSSTTSESASKQNWRSQQHISTPSILHSSAYKLGSDKKLSNDENSANRPTFELENVAYATSNMHHIAPGLGEPHPSTNNGSHTQECKQS